MTYKENKKLVTQINKAKRNLILKAKEKGSIWENFGQKEEGKLKDKFINLSDYTDEMNEARDLIKDFDDWACNFNL